MKLKLDGIKGSGNGILFFQGRRARLASPVSEQNPAKPSRTDSQGMGIAAWQAPYAAPKAGLLEAGISQRIVPHLRFSESPKE
ncbi:MAG TPA: hypothetical protein PKZ27_12810 [Rhodocyclaceae bacterium]|nr:hypothetical protein [Rhodocyclaceae bacterium]